MKKILFIGYPTYGSDSKIVGGTELVNDTILKIFKSVPDIQVQYVVTKRVSDTLVKSYSSTYDCEVRKSREYCVEDLRTFSPDLVLVSMCNPEDDPIFDVIRSIEDVPVWVYTHMSTDDLIDGYKDLHNRENFYYSYLSDRARHIIVQQVSEDQTFRFYNPVVGHYDKLNLSDYYNYDILINSRIVKQKGIDNTINLCNRVNWSTALVGACSSMCRNLLKEYVESFKHLGSQYLGTLDRPQLLEDLRHVKFLSLLPNGPEGFGLCLVEAMAVGTPVITWKDLSEVADPQYNILLTHDKYFIDEFVEEYLPRIDDYLNPARRKEMKKITLDLYGESAYKVRVLNKVNDLIMKGNT